MPLHFEAMVENRDNSALFEGVIHEFDTADEAKIASDGEYIHVGKSIIDKSTGTPIGKYVFTLKKRDDKKAIELLDLDIIWNNPNMSSVQFVKRLEKSSDSNEYYEAESLQMGQHFILETVNRHLLDEIDLVGTTRDVSFSVFPFELTVFENMDQLNQFFGFNKEIRAGDTDLTVGGLADTFMAPGGMLQDGDNDYSFVIGKIKEFRDVRICIGDNTLEFVLAWAETGVGIVPVCLGRDVFDLSKLKENCVVGMNAFVKACLAQFS